MIYQQFLNTENGKICVNCMLHNSSSIIIICPGHNLSKSGPFFLLTKIAKINYSMGHSVILFDYLCEGDSDGNYRDASVELSLYTIKKIKEYAYSLGYHNFIYIGYGVGNILISECIDNENTKGIVLLFPFHNINKRFDYIHKNINLQGEMFRHSDGYIWPRVEEPDERFYWRSIVGIAEWLYYTPFSIKYLEALSRINMDNIYTGVQTDVLVFSNKSWFDIIKNERNLKHIVVDDIFYGPRERWEASLYWPNLWDQICSNIAEYLKDKVDEIDNKRPLSVSINLENAMNISEGHRSIIFESEGKTLFGIMHVPKHELIIQGTVPLIIYEPGLGGSRVDIGRSAVDLCDALSLQGFVAVRYDSVGSGVSEGEFEEISWNKRKKNLEDLIEYLSNFKFIDMSNIVLVSYSAGAKVVLKILEENTNIKNAVMWSPNLVKNSSEKKIKGHLRNKTFVFPMAALWLGQEFIIDDARTDFMELLKNCKKEILIINGMDRAKDPNIDAIETCVVTKKNISILYYPGHHCFMYKYMKAIIKDTVNFIQERLANKLG